MNFRMIAGFPSNGFTDRLLAEMELDRGGHIEWVFYRVFSRLGIGGIPKIDYEFKENHATLKPTTFRDCLLFVGLHKDSMTNTEKFPVRDGKILYYYEDGTLKKRPDTGYEVCYQVLPDNRLKLGYCGPVFKEYREKVSLEVDELSEESFCEL